MNLDQPRLSVQDTMFLPTLFERLTRKLLIYFLLKAEIIGLELVDKLENL
jgi:hypothetical protein